MCLLKERGVYMMNIDKLYEPYWIRFYGRKACFTNPAFRAEGTTYDVPTPSAIRGMIDSIFWKPEFHWEIREIRVMKPIQSYIMTVNGFGNFNTMEDMQKHMTFLYDVEYEISADLVLHDENNDMMKYHAMFLDRLNHGRCRKRPWFGISDCPCLFEPVGKHKQPIDLTKDFGNMFFDFVYNGKNTTPIFYNPKMVDGIIVVPQKLYGQMNFGRR
jgi:CRISPR-associated protein Cas5d